MKLVYVVETANREFKEHDIAYEKWDNPQIDNIVESIKRHHSIFMASSSKELVKESMIDCIGYDINMLVKEIHRTNIPALYKVFHGAVYLKVYIENVLSFEICGDTINNINFQDKEND